MDQAPFIIKPRTTSFALKELWQHKELLYFFTWRDIKVRYKQTALGLLWVVLQPLGMMLIFTLLFSNKLISKDQTTLPYPVFVLSGIVLWNLFFSAVSHAAESMVTNANIIKKVYFPRLIIPLSAMATALVDFVVAAIIFFIVVLLYSQSIQISMLAYFPFAIVIILLAAFGLGSLLAALNIKYRDFRYALPFLLQVLFFASQVIYSIDIVANKNLQYLLALNPVNAAIELTRSGITHLPPDAAIVLIGFFSALLLAVAGLFYFRKTEFYFADIA